MSSGKNVKKEKVIQPVIKKGLSDKELVEKYEAGGIDLSKVLKPMLNKSKS